MVVVVVMAVALMVPRSDSAAVVMALVQIESNQALD